MTTYARILSMLICLAMMSVPAGSIAAGPSSEFLDIHPELKPDPDRPGASMWQKPGFDRTKYTKVMLEPLSIFLAPDSEYKGLTSDDVNALSSGFRDAAVRVLAPEIQVVDVPGSGVLSVRTALTGVKLKKERRGLLGYTPIGIVVTAARDSAGKRISLENATLEMEVYDAATGEPVGVIVDNRPRTGSQEELSWKSIEDTFRFYATRFKSRILAARESQG